MSMISWYLAMCSTLEVLTSVDGDRTIQLRGHSHILTKSGNTTISRFTQHGVNLRYYRHCIRGQGSFPTPILVKTFSEEWQFECEATSYALLKDLQGDIVPRCYGNFTTLQSNKAILIELLPGHDLSKAVIDREYVPHIRKALEHCYRELAQRGVCQSDPKPTNVMLVELTGLAYLSWLPRMIFNGSSCNVARTKSGGLGARNFLLPLVTCILSIWYAGVGDSLRITLQVISAIESAVLIWLLSPSISRVIIIDFSVARHHDAHIFRTNRNDAESIATAVASRFESNIQKTSD